MATHSSVLAWRIPGTGEPVGLPSMGSYRVGHDWSNLAVDYSISGFGKEGREGKKVERREGRQVAASLDTRKRTLVWALSQKKKRWCYRREVTQSWPTLRDPMDYSLPGFSIHGIFQARVLEWGAIAFSTEDEAISNPLSSSLSWGLSQLTCICLSDIKKESEVAQSCLTLWDPMDCSLPCSCVHGIFQARVLEWVAISFSRRSSWPRDWTWVSRIVGRHLNHLSYQGSPCLI